MSNITDAAATISSINSRLSGLRKTLDAYVWRHAEADAKNIVINALTATAQRPATGDDIAELFDVVSDEIDGRIDRVRNSKRGFPARNARYGAEYFDYVQERVELAILSYTDRYAAEIAKQRVQHAEIDRIAAKLRD